MTRDAEVIKNLDLLHREWGHAYLIWFQSGLYCAYRRDNAAICRRVTAENLRRENGHGLPGTPGTPLNKAPDANPARPALPALTGWFCVLR